MDLRRRGIQVRYERGQTTVEYAVVVGTTVIILALFLAVMPSDPFAGFWDFVTGAL